MCHSGSLISKFRYVIASIIDYRVDTCTTFIKVIENKNTPVFRGGTCTTLHSDAILSCKISAIYYIYMLIITDT